MSSPPASLTPNLTIHHLQTGQGERIPFLLEELGLPYTLTLYQRAPILSPPALKALHPMGASPVLSDTTDPSHPILLAESAAIVEYIIYKYASVRLSLPPTHPQYSEYLYWFHFANSSLQPALARRVGLLPTDRNFEKVNLRIQRAVSHFNDRVSKNSYLAGEVFTAADVMSVWCFTTMRKFVPVDLTEYGGILAWLKRCTDRPAYQAAMGKSDPELDVEEGISAKGPEVFGAFAREYGIVR
jgi:glutathione S-transferase